MPIDPYLRELGHYWSTKWCIICSVPNQYRSMLIAKRPSETNCEEIQTQIFNSRKCTWRRSSKMFCLGLDVLSGPVHMKKKIIQQISGSRNTFRQKTSFNSAAIYIKCSLSGSKISMRLLFLCICIQQLNHLRCQLNDQSIHCWCPCGNPDPNNAIPCPLWK